MIRSLPLAVLTQTPKCWAIFISSAPRTISIYAFLGKARRCELKRICFLMTSFVLFCRFLPVRAKVVWLLAGPDPICSHETTVQPAVKEAHTMLQNLCPGKVSKLLAVLALFISTSTAFGQSAAFTYQGRLTDGGAAANGIYDMQFKLYDTATVGTRTQIGSTLTQSTGKGNGR